MNLPKLYYMLDITGRYSLSRGRKGGEQDGICSWAGGDKSHWLQSQNDMQWPFSQKRNTPTSRLLILNRTLKGQEDSEREEHSWSHLTLRLQTTSGTCSNHHSEELAGTQTHGLQERIESPWMNPHGRGQFMKIKPGTSKEERTVYLRNSDRNTGHLLRRTSVKVIL